jgi:hypothetical protein
MSDPREQEQSIKDRKKLIYDDDPTPMSGSVGKPFVLYLRETPPQPLSLGLKAALWAAGIVVLLLLAGALYKSSQPKPKPAPAQKTGAAPAPVVSARDA